MAWKISSIVVSFMALADALAMTVSAFRELGKSVLILVGHCCNSQRTYYRGISRRSNSLVPLQPKAKSGVSTLLIQHWSRGPPVAGYDCIVCQVSRKSPTCPPTFTYMANSTYIMWKSIQHNDIHGPKAAAYREDKANGEEASIELPNTYKPATDGAADAAPSPPSAVHSANQPYPGT